MVFALLVKPNWSINSFTKQSRSSFVFKVDPILSSTRKSRVSFTVRCGKKVDSCSTKALGIGESPVNGTLLMYRFPYKAIFVSSLTFPASAWRIVVFPEPEGPMIASIRPGFATPLILPSKINLSFLVFFCCNVMVRSSNPTSTDCKNPEWVSSTLSQTISSASTCSVGFTTLPPRLQNPFFFLDDDASATTFGRVAIFPATFCADAPPKDITGMSASRSDKIVLDAMIARSASADTLDLWAMVSMMNE
mmetsp:Transcript_22495/g.45268  ORF Transcript_22495/g.45268 Transcript_22495/m.45268 type:complete len:249 (+) Transcript_22495:1399-2145(+)